MIATANDNYSPRLQTALDAVRRMHFNHDQADDEEAIRLAALQIVLKVFNMPSNID